MWLFVFFDLPTDTKKARKSYRVFREKLLKDGFGMLQYSVYVRHCATKESAKVHVGRVKKWVPPEGQVSIMQITDKQYANILNYWGCGRDPLPPTPTQLELF